MWVGQGVRLSGELYTVVGVLPPRFPISLRFGASEFWTTIDTKSPLVAVRKKLPQFWTAWHA